MFPSDGYLAVPSFIALKAVFGGFTESSVKHLAYHCPVCKLRLGGFGLLEARCQSTVLPDSFIACVEMGSGFKSCCPGRLFPDAPFQAHVALCGI